MLNRHDIIGNLGRDPETRYTQSGEAVCNFSIATTERWKDKATGEAKEATEWHRITAFGRLAEICSQYLKKGSRCYVSGKSKTRKWQDKDGTDRYATEVHASEMKLLDSKDGERPAAAPASRTAAPAAFSDSDPGDPPF